MPRFKRGIQYAEASHISTNVSGILDRPVKPGDDDRISFGNQIGNALRGEALSQLSSPAPHPHPRPQQHKAGNAGDNAVLGVDMGHAGLMSGKKARQLIRRYQEIDAGHDEQDNAEQRENELHG
jgi:hypothetical protein